MFIGGFCGFELLLWKTLLYYKSPLNSAYFGEGIVVTYIFIQVRINDLNLDLAAGTVNLSQGMSTLQSKLTTDQASGVVTLSDGQSFNFLASRAVGDAGLY